MHRLLTLVIAALIAGPVAAGPKVMTIEQAVGAAEDPHSLSAARKTLAIVSDRDPAGLARHIAEMKHDPALSDPARERLLHDSAMAAAGLRPDESLATEIRALEEYETRTLVWSDEHGYREARPLYDFGATSRYVRRMWTEEGSRSATALAISAGDFAEIDRYAAASAVERAGSVAAFRDAAAEQLALFQPALMDAMGRDMAVDALAAIVAGKIHDATLMEEVLSAGDPLVARQVIDTIQSPEWEGEAGRLLRVAALRDDVGSVAILAIGRAATTDPDAMDFLFLALDGPSGASAAAALARIGDDEVVYRLTGILQAAGDDVIRRHALLALRLAGSPAATRAMGEFARDPASPPELVAEIPSWLRD